MSFIPISTERGSGKVTIVSNILIYGEWDETYRPLSFRKFLSPFCNLASQKERASSSSAV
jgi:hypothetical protein